MNLENIQIDKCITCLQSELPEIFHSKAPKAAPRVFEKPTITFTKHRVNFQFQLH